MNEFITCLNSSPFSFLPFYFLKNFNNPNRGKEKCLASCLLYPGRPLWGPASALAAVGQLLERHVALPVPEPWERAL